MAARAAAERMAHMLGEAVGDRVGYRIRQDSKIGPKTRIEVVTGGVFSRLLQEDPALEDYSLVIFDEFHERNLDSDLGLALTLQGRELLREPEHPLKLLVMSATLDGERISTLLGHAPLVRSEGRLFDVDVRYLGGGRLDNLVTECSEATIEAHQSLSGNILLFLPGQQSIHAVAQRLGNQLPDATLIAPLYGSLSLEEQRAAIAPLSANSNYQRKVVLATDIAETSLTIEGITVVIDSGFRREPRFDPRTGLTRLETRRISQASATQRAGRAGRVAPGHCWRLWKREDTLQAFAAAEIEQADLLPLVLQMLNFGVHEIDELKWLTPPPNGAFQQALQLLQQLGATQIDNPYQLTSHGQAMASFPAHPRLAHMLLRGAHLGLTEQACYLAAALAEPNRPTTLNNDVEQWLSPSTSIHKQREPWHQRVHKQSAQYLRDLTAHRKVKNTTGTSANNADSCGMLLAMAYPDRIAKRRDQQDIYQLANGRSAKLGKNTGLSKWEWLAVAETGGQVGRSEDIIYSAAPLNPKLFKQDLSALVKRKQIIEWHDKNQRFHAEQLECVGQLIWQRKALSKLSGEEKTTAICTYIQQKGLSVLPWDEQCKQWQARVELLRQLEPENLSTWPDVSDNYLLCDLNRWLKPYLQQVHTQQDIKKLPLYNILQNLLLWPMQKQLEQLAPSHITVPSGSSKTIDYLQQPPVLAVKLQEMFGCETTPTVANGKVALLVHLLSPAQRPLQVTQDLAGFWRSSYQEVKKEMRGRYPKHPWPDDPTKAVATRFTKNKI